MKAQFGLILLRGSVVPAILALFAASVSVSENAAAQAVQLCHADSLIGTADPHLRSNEPGAGEGFGGVFTGSGNVGRCDVNAAFIRITFPNGALTVSGETRRYCGACRFASECNSIGSALSETVVFYTISGQRGATTGGYCGPRSQCNAGGGVLEDGTRCTCDSGNVRSNGICVTGELASACATHEEHRPNEDNEADTLGVCDDRNADDCEDWEEFAVLSTGGTCIPRTATDCARWEEFTSVSGGGTCAPRTAMDCQPVEEFIDDPNGNDGGTCECVSPNTRINGVCEVRTCAADEALLQDVGAMTYDSGTCVTKEECNDAPNLILDPQSVRPDMDDLCRCPISGQGRLNFNTPNDLSDDICVAECASDYILLGTKCLCGANPSSAGCTFSDNDAECAMVFPGTRVIYDPQADENCRLPGQNSECAEVEPSTPIFDEDEANNCRERAQGDCPDDSEFVASEDPADGGGMCTVCPTNEVSTGGNACECRAPHFEAPGECRLPARNSECVGVDPTMPIFDEDEANNCRERAPGDCPDDSEFAASEDPEDGGGMCTACPTNEVSTGGNACECRAPYFEAPGECRLPAEGSECALAVPSMPIFDEDEANNCRERAQGDCPDDSEFVASDDPADGGGTCNACEPYEISRNGAECRPREEADCADHEEFQENTARGGGICEARTATDCADDHEFMEDGTNDGGTCNACEPYEISRNGAECRLREETDCADHEDLMEDMVNGGGVCEARTAADCPVRHKFILDAINGGGVCEARTAADCEDDHEFRLDASNDGGTCDACEPYEISRNGDECRLREEADCASHEQFREDMADGGGICDARTAADCGRNERFMADASGEGGTCVCPFLGFVQIGEACQIQLSQRDCDPNGIYNSRTNACRPRTFHDCAPNYRFTAAENGGTCAPTETADCGENQAFTASATGEGGFCRTCPNGTELVNNECVAVCLEEQARNESGICECPSGQRENAGRDACEEIPPPPPAAVASDDGDDDMAAILAAAPVALMGGYLILGGFGYIDPAYDFGYSGENGHLDWHGNAGFNLRHGGLRSYAIAIQSDGDAVSYESGISFEKDSFALTYDAIESQSDYKYDLGAQMNYDHGLWTISPIAAAEFQYRTDGKAWDSDASVGLEAAWTAHRWLVSARSDFASDVSHEVGFELRF